MSVLHEVRESLVMLERPLAEARGLPAAAYVAPEVFAHEQERLFRGGWMSVAFSHDVPNAGDVLPVTVAGAEILVVRGSDGRVRGFGNVCRHRGSIVVDAPASGAKTLTCPYHGWTYALDGRLLLAPMWQGPGGGKLGSLDADAEALTPIACGEWEDIIFVNVDGRAPPLADYVAPLARRWERLDLLGSRRPFAHRDRVIPANWKVVLEGFLEVYHEACLHRSLTYRIDAQGRPTWIDVLQDEVMGFTGLLPASSEKAVASPLARLPGMPPTGAVPNDIFLLFPATAINVLEDHVVRTIWTPVSATETRWRSAWYFASDAQASEDVHRACTEIVDFWLEIRGEDLSAIRRVQRGLSSAGASAQAMKFSPFWEESVRHFQRHIARRLSAA